MKPGTLLIAALIASALYCHAQDTTPPSQPPKPDAPATVNTSAPQDAKPAAPDTTQPAEPGPANSSKPADATSTTPADAKSTVPAIPKKAAPPAAPPTYIIGPIDGLTVTVLKEPTLSGGLLVRPDGMISMPLLGDVQASGLTPLQLADEIAAKLKKYIQDPNVSVVITAINSKKVYLMGEVGHTGAVDLTPGMTLLDAIATAGGLTQFANSKKMYILRNEAGKHFKIPLKYKAALKGDSFFNVNLQPGDTIVVP